MKKSIIVLACLAILAAPTFASVFSYSFPKAPVSWGNPVSFNNLSPGFFQIMFRDVNGIVRIATYGIAGGSMDTLKDPQLMMVFTFDKTEQKVGLNLNE
jgi:hypothetical protein